ncbi:MAG: hypothetical protein QW646_05335 [Ignisphaera sp.]
MRRRKLKIWGKSSNNQITRGNLNFNENSGNNVNPWKEYKIIIVKNCGGGCIGWGERS